MNVTCAVTNFFALADTDTVARVAKYLRVSSGQLPLSKDKQYTVYGITFRDGFPWYYICHHEHDDSPTPYPAELFEIRDGRLPKCWTFRPASFSEPHISSLLAFPEWASNDRFLEDLVDGAPYAVTLFVSYKKIMDEEFLM